MEEDRLRASAPTLERPDAVAVLGLLLILVTRWWYLVFWSSPHFDEIVYLEAFRAVSASESPYGVHGYFYSQGFAAAGSYLLETLGLAGVLATLRVANLLGLCVAVWYSLSWWPASRLHRLLVAVLYLSLSPAIELSLVFGNISFLVIGLIMLGLAMWSAKPGIAGAFLGLSIGIKPLAPLAALALGVHRPRVKGRAHWIAGGLGVLISLVMFLPLSRLMDMTSQPITGVSYYRTISLHRILKIVGLEVTPVGAMILVTVITVLVCRCVAMSFREIVCMATTASVLATPVIWPHTLLLVLPVQVIALERAWARRTTQSSSSRYELGFVILAIAALQLFNSNGSELVDVMAAPLRLAVLGLPYVSAPALTAYIFVTGRQTRASLASQRHLRSRYQALGEAGASLPPAPYA